MATEEGRRGFFLTAIYGLWGVIAAAIGLPAAGYLLVPPKARDQEEWAEVGDVTKLTAGSPVEMVFRRNRVDGWRVLSEKSTAWVLRTNEKDYVAYAPMCTHLGCAYHWDERGKEFLCPCHTSTFSLDGRVTAGPAPRPLDRYAIKVENGKLFVGRIHEQRDPKE